MFSVRVAAALAVPLFFAPACSSIDHEVDDIVTNAVVGPDVLIASGSTYAWGGALAEILDPDGAWVAPGFDVDSEIQYLVDRELRERGMVKVTDNPALLVYYGVGIDMTSIELVQNSTDDPARLEEIPRGAMAVAVRDAATGRMLWIGAAKGTLQDNPNNELVKKRLDYAVDDMFSRFPK